MAIDKTALLQAELNMRSPPEGRVIQLQQLLEIAAARISQYGITLNDDDPADLHLHVEFAAWLYRRRAQADAAIMPRYLQLDIHDRLVAEKGAVPDG